MGWDKVEHYNFANCPTLLQGSCDKIAHDSLVL